MQPHKDNFLTKITDAIIPALLLASIFLTLLGLVGIKQTKMGMFYEASRVLDSLLRWSVSDKGADWGEFVPVEDGATLSAPSPEQLQHNIDQGVDSD